MTHPHLTTSQLTDLVHRAFPGTEVDSCEPLPGDHANALYRLSLRNGLDVVLKLYTGATDSGAPDREVQLLRMVTSETGVPVPRVLYFAQSEARAGPPGCEDAAWTLLTRLPGASLTHVIDALDTSELEALGYEAGRYVARVHGIPLDRFGSPFAPSAQDHEREKGYVMAQADAWLDRCAEQALLPGVDRDALRHRFAESTVLDRRQPCLVHGRLRACDIMVERGATGHHVTGLTDWSAARAAAPELDLSTLFAIDFANLPGIQKGFLDGYTEAGDLPATFWDRLAVYQAFAALEWLLIAHQQGRPQGIRTHRDQISRFLGDGGAPPIP
ncbi:MAG: phosphotransferase [Anaerolineae bacterium]|nr:phosphotransferase [Anaerolineae bacterium]